MNKRRGGQDPKQNRTLNTLFLTCADAQHIISSTSLLCIQHHNVPRLCFLEMITVILKSQYGNTHICTYSKIKIHSRVKFKVVGFLFPFPHVKTIDQTSVLALGTMPIYVPLHRQAEGKHGAKSCPPAAAHLDQTQGMPTSSTALWITQHNGVEKQAEQILRHIKWAGHWLQPPMSPRVSRANSTNWDQPTWTGASSRRPHSTREENGSCYTYLKPSFCLSIVFFPPKVLHHHPPYAQAPVDY